MDKNQESLICTNCNEVIVGVFECTNKDVCNGCFNYICERCKELCYCTQCVQLMCTDCFKDFEIHHNKELNTYALFCDQECLKRAQKLYPEIFKPNEEKKEENKQ